MSRNCLTFLLFVALAPLPVRAETELRCPPTLAVTSTAEDLRDWQSVNIVPDRVPLERMAIRPGRNSKTNIAQTGFLRLEQGDRKTIQASWDLVEIRRTHPDLWLACLYTDTTIALLRPVPNTAAACEFRVETAGDSLHESAICR